MRPVADRACRNAERRLLRLADAEMPGRCVLPGKEREDRAGLALLVAVIEVIGAGIVEVDGLFHQPQAEHAGVEIEIAFGTPRDGGDVMDAGHVFPRGWPVSPAAAMLSYGEAQGKPP